MRSIRRGRYPFWVCLLSLGAAIFGCPHHGPMATVAAWAVCEEDHTHGDLHHHHSHSQEQDHDEVCTCLFNLDFLNQSAFTVAHITSDRGFDFAGIQGFPLGVDSAGFTVAPSSPTGRSPSPLCHHGARLPVLSCLLI